MDPNSNKEVLREFPRLFRQYKDGTVERFMGTDTTPPGTDPLTNAQSKDVTINPQRRCRPPLPPTNPAGKLPSSSTSTAVPSASAPPSIPPTTATSTHSPPRPTPSSFPSTTASHRNIPPPAYDDTWEAIQWTAKHAAVHGGGPEPWLNDHADFSACS
ncbi:putative carboxylesterase [Arachis hypogaea]|nr:putative carboxylesterase [Arachis hypogaea]